MTYKATLERIRTCSALKTGQRRRKTLEEGELEEEDMISLWRETKMVIADT